MEVQPEPISESKAQEKDEDRDTAMDWPEKSTYSEIELETEPASSPAPKTITLPLNTILLVLFGVMIGAVVGYLSRPMLNRSTPPAVVAPQASEPDTVAEVAAGPAEERDAAEAPVAESAPAEPAAAAPEEERTAETAAESADREAALQELMAVLVSQTRHFKGNPDAPVTIIEFSDFQ